MTTAFQMQVAVCNYMVTQGFAPMIEYVLPGGRRLDVAALGFGGRLIGIEIKISESDFNRDLKWSDAMNACFLYYFAVPAGFNHTLIHPGIRVMTVTEGVCHISRRTGKGLLSPHLWQQARGRYAVKPGKRASPLRSDPTGDARPPRLWMP